MFGYMGKLLRVNLTTSDIKIEDLDFEMAKKFVGGRGLGTKILMDEIDPTIDALSPENKIIFINGPMSGTPTPTGGRYMVVTKSPLSGTIASSNSGGTWGARLKYAGFDGIIVEGKSEKPVYLEINESNIQIKDASNVWGKYVSETTDILAKPGNNVLTIGPAGEKLSKMAAIMNEKDRAAGRSGVGAVMGSKNLKAIVTSGKLKPELANAEELKVVVKDANKKIRENGVTGQGLPTYGTAVLVNIINANGIMPVNNFQEGVFEHAEDISGETLAEKYLVRKDPCHRCPIGCGRYCKTDKVEGGGPEYETIWAFGSDCGVKDLEKVIEANYWCNQLGLDTISAGSTLAAAMELYEQGDITDADFDGVKLEFGNEDSIVHWTKKMGLREDFGDKLADGSYRLCESYGKPELSMSVKKLEIPAYDPRGVQGHGLQYATSNRGGCHVRGYMISPEILALPEKLERLELDGKEVWVKIFQDLTAFIDSSGLCLFTSFAIGAQEYADMFNSIVGTNWTADDVLKAGERIYNLEKQFNIAAGITPEEDTLPPRLLNDPMPSGPTEGHVHHLDKLLPKYYEVRGWDETGAPTPEKLKELGL
ncbi:aldehyde ferredoxin oxidoreductase family protein [Mycoplasmatota bacterium]|nr:aldehyde ferredoxin oxidoreductase family protein [Mycoplasmatota bacterium]